MPADPHRHSAAALDAVLRECERWIAAVATDGALSGIAVQRVRSEINQLYAALQSRLATAEQCPLCDGQERFGTAARGREGGGAG